MSLLEKLDSPVVWDEYLAYKREKAHLSKREDAELAAFVAVQGWKATTQRLKTLPGDLGTPQKRLVNKLGKSTKRVVYRFADDVQQVLKLLAWLLYDFDAAQPKHCYSFRRGINAHTAIRRLTTLPHIDDLYCYKLDIHNYFNSINVEKLLPILKEVFVSDEPLYQFFFKMLGSDEAIFDGKLIREKRGVMAGTPTAPFLANLYLRDMDNFLARKAEAYARYSDDVILFAQSEDDIKGLRLKALQALEAHYLTLNPEKEKLGVPGEAWEFLGFSYKQGIIDLSASTQRKLKGKIRRKARALRRWMLRKDASGDRAIAAMIRSMNRKFFEQGKATELTWSRWFFPLLNTSESLKQLDAYLQQELRTIATGKHSKRNYRLSYSKLKELGYRSLVSEYYRFIGSAKVPNTLS